jgi:hypothetical protein
MFLLLFLILLICFFYLLPINKPKPNKPRPPRAKGKGWDLRVSLIEQVEVEEQPQEDTPFCEQVFATRTVASA